jgi:hypothetical protein
MRVLGEAEHMVLEIDLVLQGKQDWVAVAVLQHLLKLKSATCNDSDTTQAKVLALKSALMLSETHESDLADQAIAASEQAQISVQLGRLDLEFDQKPVGEKLPVATIDEASGLTDTKLRAALGKFHEETAKLKTLQGGVRLTGAGRIS